MLDGLKCYRFLIVLIFVGLLTGLGEGRFAYGQAVSGWVGTFFYEGLAGFDGGGTAATGNPIVLDLTLDIDPQGGCTLEADGFQTDDMLNCKAVARGDLGVDILFTGFPAGATEVNGFLDNSYQPGDLLFSLLPAPGHGVITRWGAINPPMANTEAGTFFERKS
jgi:hypothetical protein